MSILGWIALVALQTGVVNQDASKNQRTQHYQGARMVLMRFCDTQSQHPAAKWITPGTYVEQSKNQPVLMVLIDQGPQSQVLVAKMMKKLTSPETTLPELIGISFRIVKLKKPTEFGWAEEKERPRYQKARAQLLDYAQNEAGTDSDAPLLVLTQGTHVRRDPKRGIKLMLISRTPADGDLDYSGLSLEEVMQHFTHKSSPIPALQGILYEIRYLPRNRTSENPCRP